MCSLASIASKRHVLCLHWWAQDSVADEKRGIRLAFSLTCGDESRRGESSSDRSCRRAMLFGGVGVADFDGEFYGKTDQSCGLGNTRLDVLCVPDPDTSLHPTQTQMYRCAHEHTHACTRTRCVCKVTRESVLSCSLVWFCSSMHNVSTRPI